MHISSTHAVRSYGGALAVPSCHWKTATVWLFNGGAGGFILSETGSTPHEIPSNAMPKQLVKLKKSAV